MIPLLTPVIFRETVPLIDCPQCSVEEKDKEEQQNRNLNLVKTLIILLDICSLFLGRIALFLFVYFLIKQAHLRRKYLSVDRITSCPELRWWKIKEHLLFYATVEDIMHFTNRHRFSNDLALWYCLEIYRHHLEF